ncbi:T9SS type A sorting domain-containing protein [Patiriisocius marinus]|uniref:T9SS type A sorting domain-containing protein n=1 Tax=Patiriisocius marinus TaxID=1397112 RepID=UPI00232E0D91|nr:T9SS type A sorting domain-containing protein [Patiriisocius marinus]
MIKYYSKLLLILVSILTINSYAQSVSLPQASISVTPLGTVENNGTAIAEFIFVESSGVDVQSTSFDQPNVSINVDFLYIELADADISQITGTLLDYFVPVYDATNNMLRFDQTAVIPGDWFGYVNFPIDVTQNSTQDESFNGFNANITAVDAGTDASGNASIFTYTDEDILFTEDIEPLVFNVSPNPTTGIFNINLENSNDTQVELFDILGKLIISKDYYNVDSIELNIDYLSSAVYVLKVTSDNGATNTVKVIKE